MYEAKSYYGYIIIKQKDVYGKFHYIVAAQDSQVIAIFDYELDAKNLILTRQP